MADEEDLMAASMVKEIQELRERLIAIEVESRSDRRWLLIVGVLLLGVLGYTNFVALPNEVKSQLPGAVTREVNKEAPKRVQEAFAAWLNTNNGGAILESVRRAQAEVSQIAARAKSDEAQIKSYLQEQKVSGLDDRVETVRKSVVAVDNRVGQAFSAMHHLKVKLSTGNCKSVADSWKSVGRVPSDQDRAYCAPTFIQAGPSGGCCTYEVVIE